MTQTAAPEAPAAAGRIEPAVSPVEAPAPPAPDDGTARVTLRARLSRLVAFHPAVGVSDIVFPEPTRHRRSR